MLVLGRKPDETIVIITPTGEHITMRICRLARDYVRLGFEAPNNYMILRGELLERQEKDTTHVPTN